MARTVKHHGIGHLVFLIQLETQLSGNPALGSRGGMPHRDSGFGRSRLRPDHGIFLLHIQTQRIDL